MHELLELIGARPRRDGAALPGPALRRPAPARRRRAGARRRPAADADGRAVRRDRPDQPRASCRTSSSRCRQQVRKTVVFVTHDIDEAIKMGDRIAILREGGVLAQYAPPAEILDAPRRRLRRRVRRRRPRAQAPVADDARRAAELLAPERRRPRRGRPSASTTERARRPRAAVHDALGQLLLSAGRRAAAGWTTLDGHRPRVC